MAAPDHTVVAEDRYGRYLRQMAVPGFGKEAQDKLFAAHVLILGVGGLGTVSSTYLTRAGIGALTIIDSGTINTPDLNRQIFYTEEDVGLKKVDVAARRLEEINPNTAITALSDGITEASLSCIIRDADVVIDGLDNFQARMDANRVCCANKKIFIHGGIHSTKGVVSTIVPGEGPCLRCIYGAHPPDEPSIPVLGPVAGIVASIQSLEAINHLCGSGISLKGRLLMFETRTMNFFYRQVDRLSECDHCSGT
jgi:molybdopterin-synthase adenylyltransferase